MMPPDELFFPPFASFNAVASNQNCCWHFRGQNNNLTLKKFWNALTTNQPTFFLPSVLPRKSLHEQSYISQADILTLDCFKVQHIHDLPLQSIQQDSWVNQTACKVLILFGICSQDIPVWQSTEPEAVVGWSNFEACVVFPLELKIRGGYARKEVQ